jgi:hypothetical protein
MIAYDKIKLNKLLLTDIAKYFKRCDLITDEELIAIGKSKSTTYHRTNIFIRAGVLFLTMLLAFSSCGLMVLFTGLDSFITGFKIALLFFAMLTISALEYFIKNKNNYASGIDDGLLYFALCSFALFLGLTVEPNGNAANILFYGLLSLAGLAAFIRYTDALVATVSYCTFLATCFFMVMLISPIAKLIMPFVIFILSMIAYILVKKKSQQFVFRFYLKGLECLQWAALLSLYFSVNYFVVREASVNFFDMILKSGEEIPLYFLFYFFTITIPLVYVFMGIKNKDSIRLNCGLILIAVSIATIRYYHQILPLEYALTLGGLLLLAIAALLFRYLKTPKKGFTSKEDKGNRNWFSKDVEAILIAQSMAYQQPEVPADNLQGGGKFGGGGAGESF